MMKTKRLLCVILLLCALLSLIPATGVALGAEELGASSSAVYVGVTATPAAAAYSFKVYGTYDYDEAFEVLSQLNTLRAGLGLSALTMDTILLDDAMQRAVEISINFSHDRPDGTSCFTVFPSGYSGAAENIASGQNNATAVMTSWINSSGHYANMINAAYDSVGIGCFYQDGRKCWVQLFTGGLTPTAALNPGKSEYDRTISALGDILALDLSPASANLLVSEKKAFTLSNTVNKGWPSYGTITLIPSYCFSSDNSVVTVDSAGVATAAGLGTATLRIGVGSDLYKEASVTVSTTTKTPLDALMFSLNTSDEVYTGNPILKSITSTLTLGTDYSVTYTNNTNVGTATIKITGQGAYTGELVYNFSILRAYRVMSAGGLEFTEISGTKPAVITDNASKDSPVYTYSSSNTAVATVSAAGVVTPTGYGTATITVTAAQTANYTAGSTTFTVTVTNVPNPTPFTDIAKTDWFYKDVVFCYEKKLINGTTATTFSPYTPLNRAMVVTVLYRAAGSPSVSGITGSFTDVPAGQWYTDAVKWASNIGIVNGYGDGKYGPLNNVTRQDMVTIMNRYATIKGLDITLTRSYTPFPDDALIADYAKNGIIRFYRAEIINGRDTGYLDPKGNTSRAEFAAVLHRFMDAIA